MGHLYHGYVYIPMVFLSRVISSIQVMGINMVALCEGLSVGQKAGLSGKDILEARARRDAA